MFFQCRCYQVTPIPGKGLGVVATRDIAPGEVVMVETAVMVEGERGEKVEEQFEKLSDSVKKRVLELNDPEPSGEEEGKVRRIFTSNAIHGLY